MSKSQFIRNTPSTRNIIHFPAVQGLFELYSILRSDNESLWGRKKNRQIRNIDPEAWLDQNFDELQLSGEEWRVKNEEAKEINRAGIAAVVKS